MDGLDDALDVDAVSFAFARPPDHAIAGDQRTDSAAYVATVDATVGGFDIGMHAKAANDGPFGFLTEQVVIKIGLLRSRFQAALVVGLHAALLAFGEFILLNRTGSWSPCTGKTSMIHAILDEYSDVEGWKIT